MLSREILEALEQVAAVSGKNGKRALLATFMQDADFRDVMFAMYDPFTKYGVGVDVLGRVEQRGLLTGQRRPNFDDRTQEVIKQLAAGRLTGDAARRAVEGEFYRLNDPSVRLLWRILKKDARAGFSEESLNKAYPGFVATFPYMRCESLKKIKLDKLPWDEGIFVQKKADGMFVNVNLAVSGPTSRAVVSFVSRQGKEFPAASFAELVQELQIYFTPGYQLHGELLVERNGVVLPREQSNGILNSVAQGEAFPAGHRPILEVWDRIPLASVVPKGTYKVPYSLRFKALADSVPPSATGSPLRLIPSIIVHSKEEMMNVYRRYLQRGEEGAVGKNPRGTWKDGTSKDQWKLKDEQVVSVRLTALRPGEGKNAATFGALEGESEDGLLVVGVAGITDAARADIFARREELLGNAIFDVKANGIMKPTTPEGKYSLFLPRFVELRTDKSKADTLYEIQQQFDSAVR